MKNACHLLNWKVSLKSYPMGKTPESFIDEPAREATAGETLYLTAYQTGEVEADVCDYNSGEWMGGTMIVPLADAVWSEKLQRFNVYVTYPWG